MDDFKRIQIAMAVLVLVTIVLGVPAFAQQSRIANRQSPFPFPGSAWIDWGSTDFAGEWGMRFYEEEQDRTGGPSLGDFLGVPLSEAGRAFAESFDPAEQSLPAWQCKSHAAPYQWRGAGPTVRIIKDIDRTGGEGRTLAAYEIQYTRPGDRVVFLDGRPHPPATAPHSWSGFSTGEFQGNTLVITTTHLKEASFKRNGGHYSDEATITEWLIRHGEYLSVTSLIDDPIYLSQPFIQSVTFRAAPHTEVEYFPCTIVQENPEEKEFHFLPGKNPYLKEFSEEEGIPYEATRGGAETMYPDYRKKLKTLK